MAYDKELGKYGEAAEEALINYIKARCNHNIKIFSTKEEPDWSPSYDLIHGDIFIKTLKGILKIDVKRCKTPDECFIAKKSIDSFIGNYFAFVDVYNIKETIFVPKFVIRAYYEKIDNDKLSIPKDDIGYYFNPKKIISYLNLENFIKMIDSQMIKITIREKLYLSLKQNLIK